MKHFGRPATAPLFLTALVAALLWPRVSYAYIDPGTGGLFVQLILGGVAGVMVILKLYWSNFKDFFRHGKNK